ncbi:MAG TPA: chemotaxis-specific protein-glutamate methyltransferase CheB [Kineosporiaceae bacterium]|nr:chemotaxis-specific protein-glutamate methyltransferase CheB [Kineosporiaceae bacterium]
MATPVRVLVVDDSALMRKALRSMLTDAGFEVETARNGVDALDQVHRAPPDVVTLDVNMPEMDGMTCLSRLMAEHPLPVVMVSSLTDGDARITLEALELGAVDYVPKPGGTVSLDIETVRRELVAKVRAAAQARVRRSGGLRARLRHQREQAERGAPASVGVSSSVVPRETGARGRTTRTPHRPLPGQPPELVLIGSSTGGPTALSEVLRTLPRDFVAPIVIAQHIPASFTRHLAERLNDDCAVDVCEVSGIERLRPGRAYVGRGDADVVIGRRPDGLVAKSVPASGEHRWHPSVDRLVASATANCIDPRRLVGVLLTGMGDDGACELARLRELGGRTIAESEATAVVFGMPGELVRRDGADLVLPVDRIGGQLTAWG